jgi:hypothetical protein
MFFDDDLPVWGFIGKTENKPGADGKPVARQFLFTHFHFDIGFNGNQVGGAGTAAAMGREVPRAADQPPPVGAAAAVCHLRGTSSSSGPSGCVPQCQR